MSNEQQATALRLLKIAVKGHPHISNASVQEIWMFLKEVEKKAQDK